MKNPILCLAAGLVLQCGCQKAADAVIDPIESSSTATVTPNDGFIKYTIAKGEHYASNNVYKPIETSELAFAVKFDSSAIYQSIKAENQYDINKLYGFSDNNAHHHTFSARFGWSWNKKAMRLYGYIYNEGKVSSQELAAITIGVEVRCAIKVVGSAYQFFVNDKLAATMPRKAATPKANGYLLYPYFGGDEVAPHNVEIWIKKV
jgi:hypothetical protein